MDKIYSLDTIFSLSSPAVILENLKTTHASSSSIDSLKFENKISEVGFRSLLLDLFRVISLVLDDHSHIDLFGKISIIQGGKFAGPGRIFLNKVGDQFLAICFLSASRLANPFDSILQGVGNSALAKT